MSYFSDVERACVIEGIAEAAAFVITIDLVAANGRDLPPFTPGSHIDLLMTTAEGERIERQYSLCGEVADRTRYRVAVLRESDGKGGSALAHTLRPGDALRIRGPRNHFHFEPAPGAPVIFVAGGIGITPFLAMAAASAAQGIEFELHYAGRSRSAMAFVTELEKTYGQRVHVYDASAGARLDVAEVLGNAPRSSEVYCCGPVRLVQAVEYAIEQAAEHTSTAWPAGSVHVEHFEAKEFGEPLWRDSFEVELALSGMTLDVPPDRTILEVVEENGVVVVSSCRKGTCGTCETPVLEGEIEHRDSVLTPEERADGETMMICVSRANCSRLVLDL